MADSNLNQQVGSMLAVALLVILSSASESAGGVTALISTRPALSLNLDPLWKTYKLTYRRDYLEEIESDRRIIWEQNVRYILQHNLEHDLGQHSYTLGINEFTDLTTEEFLRQYFGLLKSNLSQAGDRIFMEPLNVEAYPAEVDWRKKGYVTPVKDQKNCGSCWAFSTTGSLEGQYYRKNKKMVNFSEQQLIDCSTKFGNNGCNGGLMEFAFAYLKENGIERETDYPYKAINSICKYNQSRAITKVKGYNKILKGKETDLMKAVATSGPVSVAIDASRPSFRFYKNGVYNERFCSPVSLDHAVLVVGYGSEGHGKDYWIVKNSWGTSWGKDGYILMSRNKRNQCGIASDAGFPIL